jgi:superfamily II DNA or RNA helicase
MAPGKWPKEVLSFLPSEVDDILAQSRRDDTVLLCTVQSLQAIHRDDPAHYRAVARRISIVIVDEGHYEPAPEWAKAVRELDKPTILFTATPYRNDHKLFNVHPEYVYTYSHGRAVRERYVRDVRFHNVSFSASPQRFVRELIRFYRGAFQSLKPSGVERPRSHSPMPD